ncbi:hypothetical protein FQN50_009960 [Emmonsiellopsis sp. PD_5]|nr:hypothetical protein FQN50_009960 [Emmonsiellopsis sp. PD_5]
MGCEKIHQTWIGNLLDGLELWYQAQDIEWLIGQKISEKTTYIPGASRKDGRPRSEAQAVYHCQQITGPEIGKEAIVKVRMQVPTEYPPDRRSLQPYENPGPSTCREINSLSHFNARGCSVTPKLLHVVKSLQEEWMLVPGGYIVFLVMEKVPGDPLDGFWGYDPPKREKVRAAFRRGLTELLSHNANPIDTRLGNLIYNEEKDKVWFVDYELVYVDKDQKPSEFTDSDYALWGLKHHQAAYRHLP